MSLLPAPADVLGFPAGGKFDRWRPGQDRAVMDALDAPTRFVVQVMPTGSGKSLTYVTLAALLGARAVNLTSTKALQDQLALDFGPVGMVTIKGQNAYSCRALDEPYADPPYLMEGARVFRVGHVASGRESDGCEAGPCHAGVKCRLKQGGCHFYDASRVAMAAPWVATNYAFWMAVNTPHEGKTRGLLPRDLLVLDEAHHAPDALSAHLTVRIDRYDLDRTARGIDLPMPALEASEDLWRGWATRLLLATKQKLDWTDQEVRRLTGGAGEGHNVTTELPMALLRDARALRKLTQKLQTVARMTDLAVEATADGGVEISPIWPGALAEAVLFHKVPKVVLVSATVNRKTLEQLGVPEDQATILEYPSTFPVARRRVTHVPTVRMNVHTTPSDQKILLSRVDAIISKRLDRKGIIHTVSYGRARWLLTHSKYAHLMVTHDPGATRGGVRTHQAVARFKRMTGPAILVSPSVTTGYDFPDDECRYQILIKVPYPDTRSKLVQARIARDKTYPTYVAVQDFIQACGRGVRSATDWCETLVLDDSIKWVLFSKASRGFAPAWFLDAFASTLVLPSPPRPETMDLTARQVIE